MSRQQFVHGLNHARERVAVVVTGATSVAAIINPYGRLAALDINKAGSEVVLIGDVSLGSGAGTLYTSLGDILGWVALVGRSASCRCTDPRCRVVERWVGSRGFVGLHSSGIVSGFGRSPAG